MSIEFTLPVGPNIVYKIRRRSDGLFSMGGTTPKFNNKGKIWKQKGHLTSHINQLSGNGLGRYVRNNFTHMHQTHVYEDCEIVPYEIVEQPLEGAMTIMGYLDYRENEKRIQEEFERKRREDQAKAARRREYLKLKEEFE